LSSERENLENNLICSFLFLLLFSIGPSTNASHSSNRSIFEIKTTQRVYYLMAECEEDKETWVAGLTSSMNYWKVKEYRLKKFIQTY
jgi:hypothetical protein